MHRFLTPALAVSFACQGLLLTEQFLPSRDFQMQYTGLYLRRYLRMRGSAEIFLLMWST